MIKTYLIVFLLVFGGLYYYDDSVKTTHSVVSIGLDGGVNIPYHYTHCPDEMNKAGLCKSSMPFRIGAFEMSGGASYNPGQCGLTDSKAGSDAAKAKVADLNALAEKRDTLGKTGMIAELDKEIAATQTPEVINLFKSYDPYSEYVGGMESQKEILEKQTEVEFSTQTSRLRATAIDLGQAEEFVTSSNCFTVAGLAEGQEKYIAFNQDNTIGYLKVKHLGCRDCLYGINTESIPITVMEKVAVDEDNDGQQDTDSSGKLIYTEQAATFSETETFFSGRTTTRTGDLVVRSGKGRDLSNNDMMYTTNLQFTFKCAILNTNSTNVNRTSGCENMGFIDGNPPPLHRNILFSDAKSTYPITWSLYGKKGTQDYDKFQTLEIKKDLPGGVEQFRFSDTLPTTNVFGESDSNTENTRILPAETKLYYLNWTLGTVTFNVPERTDNRGYINQTFQPFFGVYNGDAGLIFISDDEKDIADYSVGPDVNVTIPKEYDCSDGKQCTEGRTCQTVEFKRTYATQTFKACVSPTATSTSADDARELKTEPKVTPTISAFIEKQDTTTLVLGALAIALVIIALFKKQIVGVLG